MRARFSRGRTGLAARCEEYVAEVRDHGERRLGRGDALDPSRLADRARAHALIHGHAVRAGIDPREPEMQHFARSLFLISRQCGAAGLEKESRELFALSKTASGEHRAKGMDFALYGLAASILGWTLVGKLASISDAWRN